MKICFSIVGQCKSGKNGQKHTRIGHTYPDPIWAAWRDGMVWIMKSQSRQQNLSKPIEGDLTLTVHYLRGDNRIRDVTGMLDALFHCLAISRGKGAGVVSDDSQFKEVHWIPIGIDKEHPRIEIVIENLKA